MILMSKFKVDQIDIHSLLSVTDNKEMVDLVSKIYVVANNSLYFADSADYIRSLWDILLLINPQAEDRNLTYIDEL